MREGVRCQTFSFILFSCSADHERDWSPYKVVFRVGNQYAEPPKRFDIFPPDWEMLRRPRRVQIFI